MEIIIDPEFKALIPPLAADELRQLEENILRDGCRDPLVVWQALDEYVDPDCVKAAECGGKVYCKYCYKNQTVSFGDGVIVCDECDYGLSPYRRDFILIDGHNRHEICTRHGLPFETKEMVFDDRSHAIEWIIRNQFGRRNLPPYIRTKLALVLEETIAKRSQQGKRTDLPPGDNFFQKSEKSEPLNAVKELAAIAGVSHDTVAKVKKIEAKATPQVKAKLASGEISINQAHKDIVKEEKRETKKQETLSAIEEITSTDDFKSVCDIRNCSMDDLFKGLEGVDAVITDPPYPEKYLPLYEELAKHCAKAGIKIVAAMAGQSYLPQIYAAMSKHLKYRWTLAYMTPGGQAVQQWQAKVNTFWKPILLFGESEEWFGDVAVSKSNDNDKRFHGWGQSESGMIDLVDRLSKPGHLVCDPFVGAGTTAIASLVLGRKFIGCDIDPLHAETAKARALLAFNKLKK